MELDDIKAEIARMRIQIKRQQKVVCDLQRASIDTAAAAALLEQMRNTVDDLIRERNRITGAHSTRRTYASGKAIIGPSRRR